MIERFVDYLKFEKRSSNHTVISYHNDLLQFQSFLTADYSEDKVEKATTPMIRSWLMSFHSENLESSTIKRKVSTLKSFYKFLLKIEVLETNPMLKVISPKQKQRLPVFVEEKNINTLFQSETFTQDFSGLRDKLMLELLYQMGLRRTELINLKHSDYYNDYFIVLGKRDKERKIPISEKLKSILLEYFETKQAMGFESDYILLLNNGNKMYDKFVYNKVNYYLNTITTANKKSPHTLRHTFATHMLNNGADLNAIKELLGHSSLAATQVYTHNSIEKLKQSYSKAHPRA